MHAITQVTAVASTEPSTEPDLLADHALNLLLALTNADNLGLVDWDGRALAYMLGTATPATAPAPSLSVKDMVLESDRCLRSQRGVIEEDRQQATP